VTRERLEPRRLSRTGQERPARGLLSSYRKPPALPASRVGVAGAY
jgi:hypothetical protein